MIDRWPDELQNDIHLVLFVAPRPHLASIFQACHGCPYSLLLILSCKQISRSKPGTSGLVACFTHTSYDRWELCEKYAQGPSHLTSYGSKHARVHMHACADTHMRADPQ